MQNDNSAISVAGFPPSPLDAVSRLRAYIADVVDGLLKAPAAVAQSAPLRDVTADDTVLPYEREFATEREAEVFAARMAGRGHRTVVQQNVYDYAWLVEVYGAATP